MNSAEEIRRADLTEEQVRLAEKYCGITGNEEYLRLKKVPRHGMTNTFEHSVRVAEMAGRLAPHFGVEPDSAVRVGLLHDFCLINYYDPANKGTHDGRWYCFYHPEDAVQNSEAQGISLTEKEQQAILSHMFPLSTHMVKSRLGLVLTLADKTVAAEEGLKSAGIIARGFLAGRRWSSILLRAAGRTQ